MTNLITIDCHYLRPKFAASFLIIEEGKAVFIECNTAHAIPHLLAALNREGLSPKDVKYLIVTHAHLDHAGGSSTLLEACPQAVLLCHPRAARHLVDPSRLVDSAKQVYGEKRFRALYGELNPIPPEKVRAIGDGERIQFGSREFNFIHTLGHANHHLCVGDGKHGEPIERVFTGDAFGLCYPALPGFIFPSTSPTGFDPAEARLSIQKILETGAQKAALTHFGEISNLSGAAKQLFKHLDFSECLMKKAMQREESGQSLSKICEQELRNFFQKELEIYGINPGPPIWDLLSLDLELNAAGIANAAVKLL